MTSHSPPRSGPVSGYFGRGVEKRGDVYGGSALFLEAERPCLLQVGPIRGKAPGWHGNCSTLTLPSPWEVKEKASP